MKPISGKTDIPTIKVNTSAPKEEIQESRLNDIYVENLKGHPLMAEARRLRDESQNILKQPGSSTSAQKAGDLSERADTLQKQAEQQLLASGFLMPEGNVESRASIESDAHAILGPPAANIEPASQQHAQILALAETDMPKSNIKKKDVVYAFAITTDETQRQALVCQYFLKKRDNILKRDLLTSADRTKQFAGKIDDLVRSLPNDTATIQVGYDAFASKFRSPPTSPSADEQQSGPTADALKHARQSKSWKQAGIPEQYVKLSDKNAPRVANERNFPVHPDVAIGHSANSDWVQKAYDTKEKRFVAVKQRTDPFNVPPSLKELEAGSKLDHPNIVKAVAAGVRTLQDGSHRGYVITPFIPMIETAGIGSNPRQAVEDGLLALQHMHQKGVMHTDLDTRDNLVISNGHAYILDLGTADIENYKDKRYGLDVVGILTNIRGKIGESNLSQAEKTDLVNRLAAFEKNRLVVDWIGKNKAPSEKDLLKALRAHGLAMS